MGFVPIFITLGGFVFLFVLLVHQNLRQKKRSFSLDWDTLVSRVGDGDRLRIPKENLERGGLDSLEKLLRSAAASAGNPAEKAEIGSLKEVLVRAKRTRYEYNNLLGTKPYSFVASLFGHHPL